MNSGGDGGEEEMMSACKLWSGGGDSRGVLTQTEMID
jgi:hypothetical protein